MKKRRQAHALLSLSRVPPNSTEAGELHSFFLQYGREPPDNDAERVWMGDTIVKKTLLMFPQERK
jgi:acyl-coenzyme A thioesterase 9